MMKRFFYFLFTLTAGIFLLSSSVFAVPPPDAGQTFQELHSKSAAPKSSAPISLEAPVNASQKSGGKKVILRAIQLKGNTLFSEKELLGLLKGAEGNSFDFAGLSELADRITVYYHKRDYPFARAMIPAQSLEKGNLEIEVVEGRYGDIKIISEDSRAKNARAFLNVLKTGDVIKGKSLERVSLLLNDQPGYEFVPVVRPGEQTGTGDLSLTMRREKTFEGGIRFDNNGNRYTGRLRGLADLSLDSLVSFGDQISLSGVYAEWSTLLGSAGYSLPVGHSGLRANIGYNYTYYSLGKEFDSLDAHGTAQILSTGMSYPLIRSQKSNLSFSVSYQHKWLKDQQDAVETVDRKNSDSLPFSLNFDLRDKILGGGISYGSLSWTYGILNLDNGLAATDNATAKSNGSFNKLNLELSRLQALPLNFSLYGHASGQMAFNNLDSSEDFGLGGASGVRAYPSGEGYGDEGILTQVELRHAISYFSPYIFYDFGYTRTNQDPWSGGDNDRIISGSGVGLRFNYKHLSANCSVAWRIIGGKPESDSKDHIPVIWFDVGYRV